MSDLKPCPNPWCPSENKLFITWDLYSRRVFCTCGVQGPMSGTKVHTTRGVPINDDLVKQAEAEAITAWNTRAAPKGWQPIETAPSDVANHGKLGITWLLLSYPDGEGGAHVASGMRVGDTFYASGTFYCGGPFDGKQYSLREVEVQPTHWMPLPATPETET